jgi:hypothetical protein
MGLVSVYRAAHVPVKRGGRSIIVWAFRAGIGVEAFKLELGGISPMIAKLRIASNKLQVVRISVKVAEKKIRWIGKAHAIDSL